MIELKKKKIKSTNMTISKRVSSCLDLEIIIFVLFSHFFLNLIINVKNETTKKFINIH